MTDPQGAMQIRRQVGLSGCITYDCSMLATGNDKGNRRAGGLCLFWGRNIDVTLQSMLEHHIDVVVNQGDSISHWRFTSFYGHSKTEERHLSWALLRTLFLQGNLPWVVGGDFNEITCNADKEGGPRRRLSQIRSLTDALSFCDLEEIPWSGPQFTWRGNRCGHNVKVRLERFVVNPFWRSLCMHAEVRHLNPSTSDHLPILLVRDPTPSRTRRPRRFRFDFRWSAVEGCENIIRSSWLADGSDNAVPSVCIKLKHTKTALENWNRSTRCSIQNEIHRTRAKLACLFDRGQDISVEARLELEQYLSDLLRQEMEYWRQKAKISWFQFGDQNSSYFHNSVKERQVSNHISGIYDEGDNWINGDRGVGEVVVNYFSNIFSSSRPCVLPGCLESIPHIITDETNVMLSKEADLKETWEALNSMHPTKSPGPDGFSAGFFQKYWNIVGEDVLRAVRHMLTSPKAMKEVNKTEVVLIPKIKHPKRISDFRPISLCNVLYKVASKILTNRLKPLMDSLISPCQSAFVPGRLITDNVLVAYEVNHCIRRQRSGHLGLCSIKIDMSKAYDKMEWSFLSHIMSAYGFSDSWIEVIHSCISTVSYSFAINGSSRGCVIPERGLRQGDPLSPYLFLFCSELLAHLLTHESRMSRLHGIQICRNAPAITHLFFVDDSFLFCRATTSDFISLQASLRAYELATSQKVNYTKSAAMFSHNVSSEDQRRLADILGVDIVTCHGTYLGVPAEIGRSPTAAFSFIIDRVRGKIQGWKEKNLSMAGKEILIKSVAQAIPSYIMSCFEIPKGICDEINSLLASYWWGDSADQKHIHWMAWSSLCTPKAEGGLGFRDLRVFNLALLAKLSWRLLKFPDCLMARMLKARYYPDSGLLEAGRGQNSSYTSRSILAGKELLRMGLRYRVGNGSNIHIWGDAWIPKPFTFKPFTPTPPNAGPGSAA